MRQWRRSTWALVVAVIVTVGGFVTVIVSIFRDQSVVADFVRVPAGCEVVVTSEVDTTVYLYNETKGHVGDIGDCSNDDRSYDISGRPLAVTTVRSPDGAPDLEAPFVVPVFDVSYDLPDYAGRAVSSFTMQAGRQYAIGVESDDLADVVAVGRRVDPLESSLAIAGASSVMAGVGIGVVALVTRAVGRRRRRRGPWAPPQLADRAGFTGDAEP